MRCHQPNPNFSLHEIQGTSAIPGEPMDIRVASTESEIEDCFPALHELRPHLSEHEFVARVQHQMKSHGYVLVYITSHNQIVAAAGYRVAEFLAWGRIFYVDDLISRSAFRKRGYGGMHSG
jgi:hypothetical protein